jgi:hypothetical protein
LNRLHWNRLTTHRIALSALLLGLFAGAAVAQTDPYGRPSGPSGSPGSWDQYDNREPEDYYDDYDDYGDYDPTDRGRGPDVDVGFFYNELSPYGEWVRHPQYGWSWFPRHVRAGWRPYSLGRWVESDYGWVWVSDEPFGWATYHYGRWAWDPRVGWLWVPGTVWGPAWVAWQQGNGYIGWAPLPPAVGFDFQIGIRLGGFDLRFGIAPRDYAFVDERRFLDSRIGGYLEPAARNVTIINNTTNITNYTVINNRVINHGVPVDRVQRVTGRKAPRLRVAQANSPRDVGVARDVVTIYQPPQSRLSTVRVAPRNNAGLRHSSVPRPNRRPAPPGAEPDRAKPRSGGGGAGSAVIPVAPRAKPLPHPDNDRQFQRENQDLKAAQDKERRRLEQIHRQELAKAKADADAREVKQRQAAELKEQQEQRRRAAEQLRTQQDLRRAAAREPAAQPAVKPAKPGKPPVKPKRDKDKQDENDEDKPPRVA